jgi:hypothetical protein
MSGFVGAVSLSGDTTRPHAEATRLAGHYRALRGRGGRVDEVGRDAVAAAVVVGGEAITDDAGWTVVHGAAYGPRSHPLDPDDLPALDGQFAALSWDPVRRRFLAATDAFATAPVYVARRGDLVYVATSAMVLARHLRPAASREGMRHFLVTGTQYGPLTHWEGVRRLEPGTALHVDDGTVTERVHWQPEPDPAVEALDLSATVDRLTDVLVGALRERFRGRQTWIDLTGGFDSRLLALLADRAGLDLVANTRESSIHPDVAMARDIARRKDWPWREMRVPWDWQDRLPDLVDDALAAADGRLEVLQLARVAWGHRELALRLPRLLSAGGGEQLMDRMWITEQPRPDRRRPNLSRWADVIALRALDPGILAPGSYEETRARTVELVRPVAERYADEPASRQLDACYAYKSSGHFGAYRAADDMELLAQLPYYWKAGFAVSFAIDRRHRTGHRLMRHMIHRLDPEIARLPTTRGGPAAPMTPATFHRHLPFYVLLARKTVNKTSQLTVGRTPFPLPKQFGWPERESNAAVVERLRGSGVLDLRELRIRELLCDEGVRRLETLDLSGRMLGRLVTAELALARTGTEL